MQGYINNNFVQASPNGGGVLGKIFGGIADAKRAKTMMDINMEQHRQRESITTENIGQRHMLGAAAKDWVSDKEANRHYDFTEKHHKLAQTYGLQLAGYKGVNYQKEGNAKRNRTEQDPGKPGDKTDGTPKKKDATIKDSEEALKLSRGVNGRKITGAQKLSSSYEIGGKKVTEVKGSAPKLGIDKESLAAGSKGYAAKLGRNSAKKNNGVNGGNS